MQHRGSGQLRRRQPTRPPPRRRSPPGRRRGAGSASGSVSPASCSRSPRSSAWSAVGATLCISCIQASAASSRVSKADPRPTGPPAPASTRSHFGAGPRSAGGSGSVSFAARCACCAARAWTTTGFASRIASSASGASGAGLSAAVAAYARATSSRAASILRGELLIGGRARFASRIAAIASRAARSACAISSAVRPAGRPSSIQPSIVVDSGVLVPDVLKVTLRKLCDFNWLALSLKYNPLKDQGFQLSLAVARPSRHQVFTKGAFR
jgi:hypothetical protein